MGRNASTEQSGVQWVASSGQQLLSFTVRHANTATCRLLKVKHMQRKTLISEQEQSVIL